VSNTARGRLIQLQEQRFRLATTDGPTYLLTLAHNARASADDLRRWLRAGAEVTVEFDGEPGLASGVARALRRT
jgi:hypothetical protein